MGQVDQKSLQSYAGASVNQKQGLGSIEDKKFLSAKILIVDDEDANVTLLTNVLQQYGYEFIFSTTDPCQAVPLYLEYSPDIVLLDLNMPNKSGFEIITELNEFALDYLPILVLTAYSDQDIRIKALELGAKDYLVKPIDAIEVITRINNILKVKLLLDLVKEQNQLLGEKIEARTKTLRLEIIKRKEAEQETLFAVTHDALTELPNYSGLLNQLNQRLGMQDSRDKMAFLVLSLNHFNEINKTLGHQNGDVILQIAADRIKLGLRSFATKENLIAFRRGDTLARYAGGKFAIILRFVKSSADVVAISQRILKRLLEPIEIEGLVLELPATIGIAMYPAQGGDTDLLIRHAEIALQSARDNHQEITVFSSEIDTYKPERLALMADLRRALQNNMLLVYYQPIVNVRTESTASVEALVRWPQSANKLLLPNEFIPSAEKSGIIKSLTEWVLDKAVEQISNLKIPDLKVSVNMSANCLHDEELPATVMRILEKHSFPATSLNLEITESAMMNNPEKALSTLHSLRNIGVDLSIDDFGTGYSSLAYLKRLPVDQLKIDRTFISDIKMDDNDKRIVQSTIDMSHNFGLEVVAEGAEDLETVQMLKTLGVDYVQGNYFSEPMPLEKLDHWLSDTKNFQITAFQ